MYHRALTKEQEGGWVGARLVETRNMRSLAGGSVQVAGLSFPRTCFHDAPSDEKGGRVFLRDGVLKKSSRYFWILSK